MKLIFISLIIFVCGIYYVNSVCPNGCSGHGTCKNSVCECFETVGIDGGESYSGPDCSLRRCFMGNPFGAVHSKLPSSGGSSVYSPSSRELSAVSSAARMMSEVASVKLVKAIDSNKLWTVTGLEVFKDVLSKTGGILSCKYYNADGVAPASPNYLIVISFAKEYAYVLFKDAVTKIGDTPVDVTGEATYSKVECDDIISIRNDFSQLIPITITTTRILSNNITRQLQVTPPTTTVNIGNYGVILKDTGLLVEKEDKSKFVNKNMRLGCFAKTPTSATVTETPVEMFDEINAECAKDCNDISLSFKEGVTPPTTTDSCVLLMDGDGVVDIEDSEIYKNLRKEVNEKEVIYKIGKYAAVTETSSFYELGHVVIRTVEIANDATTIPNSDKLEKDELKYLNEGRVLYATVLVNGIFKEEKVEMTADNTFTAISGVVMPYVRTYPIDPLTPLPTTSLVKQKSPATLYKAYYFANDLLNSFKKEGGILHCTYTPKSSGSGRVLQGNPSEVDIDVKGIVRNSKNNEIIYSYVETSTDLSTGILKCSSVKSIRNDLTIYHPTKVEVTNGGRRQLADLELKWNGYGDMLKDLGFIKNKKDNKIACYTAKGIIEVKEYPVTIDFNADNGITFSVTSDIADGVYKCFPLMRYDGSYVSLENSDMKDKIVKDGNTYYYGDFAPLTDAIELKQKADKTKAIVLNKESSISLGDTKQIKLTLTKEIPKDLINYFKKDQVFKLKLIKTASPLEEITITIKLGDTSGSDPKTYSFDITNPPDPFDATGYTPLLALYIEIKETPTPLPLPTIKTLDSNTKLYEISDFLENEISQLPNIGGSLQCNINDKGSVEIIDVKGVKINTDKTLSGFFLFDSPLNNRRLLLDIYSITNCKVLSLRRDISLYNPLLLDSSNYDGSNVIWRGYGTIFKDIGYDYNTVKTMGCVKGSEKFLFYNVKISNVKQNGDIYDLKITVNNSTKPLNDDICYLLNNGIEGSELFELVRKDSKGDYYLGKTVIDESGRSEEIRKEDGSISTTYNENAIVTEKDIDSLDKMNIADLDKPTPSIKIPPSFIGFESQKMMQPGTTITFTFIVNGIPDKAQSSQIIRIEKEISDDKAKERFKIFLSSQLSLPDVFKPTQPPRLRSLQTSPPSVLVILSWLSEGSTHVSLECSGQGECDRTTGLCKCYDGFSGSGCQRLDCPNNCNGNGRCVALSELLSNDELKDYKGYGNKHVGEYKESADKSESVEFDNQVYGCLCDKRHRGYDCSLIECPSSEDPEGGTNTVGNEYRDCSGRGICNYSTGVCECFDGFSGEGCQNQVEMM